MTPTPIATPARQIKGILEAKYRNPNRTIRIIKEGREAKMSIQEKAN